EQAGGFGDVFEDVPDLAGDHIAEETHVHDGVDHAVAREHDDLQVVGHLIAGLAGRENFAIAEVDHRRSHERPEGDFGHAAADVDQTSFGIATRDEAGFTAQARAL